MQSQFACGQIENGKMYIIYGFPAFICGLIFLTSIKQIQFDDERFHSRNEPSEIEDGDANGVVDSRMNSGTLPRQNTGSVGGSSAVRVQIKKMQNSHSLAARERAYSTLMQNKSSEKWVELDIRNNDTSQSEPQSLASISRHRTKQAV